MSVPTSQSADLMSAEFPPSDRSADPHQRAQQAVEVFYDYNNTEMFHPRAFERGFVTSAKVGITLCVLAILANLMLFVFLCSSRKLRLQYLYIQILSIALADLGFVVMVDSFTVYFELTPWRLGAAFCKTWMLLDVALPAVSLLALLLLNVDRVLFTYSTSCYQYLLRRPVVRVLVVVFPWVFTCVVVCSLWLGFPAVEPRDEVCIYGITQAANNASSWLTVFLPSLTILVLLIFVFIAVIGEMPSSAYAMTRQPTFPGRGGLCPVAEPGHRSDRDGAESRFRLEGGAGVSTSHLQSCGRKQRRFVAALLAVDFITLAITLPYSAFSLVSPVCTDVQSCDSLQTLFQTLSWMRSSVACVRPILLILLTDIYRNFKRLIRRWYIRRVTGGLEPANSSDSSERSRRHSHDPSASDGREMVSFARLAAPKICVHRGRDESTTTSMMTPPQSPYLAQSALPHLGAKNNHIVHNLLASEEGTCV
ncbi:5-hydroxytryptamine receptor 2A-like [Aplysia californica]|uniref:5-hydroxytryptamine receptor 2A-like n=1 Tax=Aplysia californica TaxID=6500 RepID=A0ABM0K1V8_APLCA|nr:5-hydroxytryptamine receptor 2A-like [Aplysia californica]